MVILKSDGTPFSPKRSLLNPLWQREVEDRFVENERRYQAFVRVQKLRASCGVKSVLSRVVVVNMPPRYRDDDED